MSQETNESTNALFKHREELVQQRNEASKNLDKTILSVSAAALAFLVAFYDKIVGSNEPVALWSVYFAFLSLFGSIGFVTISFFTSKWGFESYIARVDQRVNEGQLLQHNDSHNRWTIATEVINGLAGAAFLAGILCILIFAYFNLEGLDMGDEQQNPENSEHTTRQEVEKGLTPANPSPDLVAPDTQIGREQAGATPLRPPPNIIEQEPITVKPAQVPSEGNPEPKSEPPKNDK